MSEPVSWVGVGRVPWAEGALSPPDLMDPGHSSAPVLACTSLRVGVSERLLGRALLPGVSVESSLLSSLLGETLPLGLVPVRSFPLRLPSGSLVSHTSGPLGSDLTLGCCPRTPQARRAQHAPGRRPFILSDPRVPRGLRVGGQGGGRRSRGALGE